MRMDAWEAGQFVALVKDMEKCGMEDGWGLSHSSEFDLESAGRRYNCMVLSGKIRAAVQMVMDCDPGSLLRPNDKCSRTQRPVIDILREKRPEARIPTKDSCHEHPNAENCSTLMPTCFYQDNVEKCAREPQGRCGSMWSGRDHAEKVAASTQNLVRETARRDGSLD